ncbi:MAG TPA: DUF6338 family protein [Acetobacteraceae bacterium]|nr:DUF6338 family protein [Acetobacteraceae bacterium]
MTEVKSLEQLSVILGYIVPGLIILYVRAQFLTGRIGPHKDALLSYFTLSIIYLAIMNAGVSLITGSDAPLYEQTRYWLPLLLIGAIVFGILIGLNASLGVTRWLLRRCGLHLPHVLDSAWDWKFLNFPESLVTLTLKDGSRIYGWCGKGSFIGSNPKDRDMYLVQVYDVDEDGNWAMKTPGKGVYIAAGEVRVIEFIPASAGEAT